MKNNTFYELIYADDYYIFYNIFNMQIMTYLIYVIYDNKAKYKD